MGGMGRMEQYGIEWDKWVVGLMGWWGGYGSVNRNAI